LQRNGAIAHVNSAGLPIGLFADAEYGTCTLQLEAGDLLAVASDGITESAGQSDEFFGGANLRACLQRAGHASAGEVLAAVFSACEEFGGDAAQRDDSSLLVLRRQ
jgi:sigma-B regulation protein RsbU (phosphoserine phosphatase)